MQILRKTLTNAWQVLFTADLKSFASYGLPTPATPSTTSTPALTPGSVLSEESPGVVTPVTTSMSTKRKRASYKRVRTDLLEMEETLAQLETAIEGDSSLADRVKRRRRGA